MNTARQNTVREWVANVANSSTSEIEAASPSVLLGIALAYLDELLQDREDKQASVMSQPATIDAEAFVSSGKNEIETNQSATTVHQLLMEHFNLAIETPAEEELPVENFTGTIAEAEAVLNPLQDHVLHPEFWSEELSQYKESHGVTA